MEEVEGGLDGWGWCDLPDDVTVTIITYLDIEDIVAFSQVCRDWRRASYNPAPLRSRLIHGSPMQQLLASLLWRHRYCKKETDKMAMFDIFDTIIRLFEVIPQGLSLHELTYLCGWLLNGNGHHEQGQKAGGENTSDDGHYSREKITSLLKLMDPFFFVRVDAQELVMGGDLPQAAIRVDTENPEREEQQGVSGHEEIRDYPDESCVEERVEMIAALGVDVGEVADVVQFPVGQPLHKLCGTAHFEFVRNAYKGFEYYHECVGRESTHRVNGRLVARVLLPLREKCLEMHPNYSPFEDHAYLPCPLVSHPAVFWHCIQSKSRLAMVRFLYETSRKVHLKHLFDPEKGVLFHPLEGASKDNVEIATAMMKCADFLVESYAFGKTTHGLANPSPVSDNEIVNFAVDLERHVIEHCRDSLRHPHVQGHPQLKMKISELLSDVLHNHSYTLWSIGRFNEGLKVGTESLELREKLFGCESEQYAATLNKVAILLHDGGSIDVAKEKLTKSLSIYRSLSSTHAHIPRVLNDFGRLSADIGDEARAKTYHEEALVIRLATLGREHIDCAQSLINLGRELLMTNFAFAFALIRDAAKIRLKHLGARHPLAESAILNLYHLQRLVPEWEAESTELRDLGRRLLSLHEEDEERE